MEKKEGLRKIDFPTGSKAKDPDETINCADHSAQYKPSLESKMALKLEKINFPEVSSSDAETCVRIHLFLNLLVCFGDRFEFKLHCGSELPQHKYSLFRVCSNAVAKFDGIV